MRRGALAFTLLLAPYTFAGDCELHETLIATCYLSGKAPRVALYCANMRDGTVKYKFLRNGMTELDVTFTPEIN